MKNNNRDLKVRPNSLSTVLGIVISSIFPIMTILMVFFYIKNDFDSKFLIGVLVGIMLSFYMAKNILLTVLGSQFIFEEDSFTIIHYTNENELIENNKSFFPKKVVNKIKYSDLSLYGVFRAVDLRKAGRDDLQRRIVTFSVNGVPMPIIMPRVIADKEEFLIFNDKSGNSIVLDGKLYSGTQIQNIFSMIEQKSTVKPLNTKDVKSLSDSKIPTFFAMVFTLFSSAVLALSLRRLEGVLVPSHSGKYESVFEYLYGLSALFIPLLILGLFALRNESKADKYSADEIKGFRKGVLTSLCVAITICVVSFTLSLFIDWPQKW